jgi:hypothetical protein
MEIIDLGELEKTEAGFTTFLKELCDNLELDFANYCAVNTMSNEVIGFTTYTDAWKEHYTEQRFQNIDPTLHLPMRSIAPIDWQRLSGHEGFDKVFENARDFNIKPQGLSIPIHGPYGEIGLISVTRDCNEDTWEKLRRKVLPELQTAAVGLHDTVMQSDTLGQALRRPHLSSRECEIWQWTAAGKSQMDIGDILSIVCAKDRTSVGMCSSKRAPQLNSMAITNTFRRPLKQTCQNTCQSSCKPLKTQQI